MKPSKIFLLLLLSLLLFDSLTTAQVRNIRVTIIYNDNAQTEVTNWSWEYRGTKIKPKKKDPFKLPSLNSSRPFMSRNLVIAHPILSTYISSFQLPGEGYEREPVYELSNKLVISLAALSQRGVHLGKLEVTEAELSSIKYIWKPDNSAIEKVVVSLKNGKTIELPELMPALSYAYELYLNGDAFVQGFKGSYSAKVSGKNPGVPGEEKNMVIVEIRFN